MRKTVLWQSPHVRVSLLALVALAAVIIVGCGGGGGGGGNTNGTNNGGNTNGNTPPPGQNPLLPFLSGRVVDTSSPAKGVVGATITLSGAGVPDLSSQVTSADGSFVIANVDPRYTAFTVTSPDTTKYYNEALYQAKTYDTLNCKLPLPTLSPGTNSLVGSVVLISAGNNPPPPPPVGGCP